MAIANFQYKIFSTARELHEFASTDPLCDAVIAIVYDTASGKFVIFYTGA